MTSPSHDLVIIGDCNPDVLVVGGDVTPAFGDYLRPLLGTAMPEIARLRMSKVAKLST